MASNKKLPGRWRPGSLRKETLYKRRNLVNVFRVVQLLDRGAKMLMLAAPGISRQVFENMFGPVQTFVGSALGNAAAGITLAVQVHSQNFRRLANVLDGRAAMAMVLKVGVFQKPISVAEFPPFFVTPFHARRRAGAWNLNLYLGELGGRSGRGGRMSRKAERQPSR